MNDNVKENNQAQNAEPLTRWEARRMRREARRVGSAGSWIGGVILIGVGVLVMLNNLGAFTLNNWWALFILLPAIGAFSSAYATYKNASGQLTGPARASLIGGLVLTMVAAIFLFDLNWTLLGPAIIILAGIGILINAVLPG